MAKLDWIEYEKTAIEAVTDGIVMLKNENVLPLKKNSRVAVFGRIQNYYYKSGTGSGGMVNVDKVIGIMDALEADEDVEVCKELQSIYKEWEKKNPANFGTGWASEPWSQEEMPLTDEVVSGAEKKNDVAIIVVGRTAGEDRDNTCEKGAYLLSDLETDMIRKVTSAFEKTILLLNVGGIIDMSNPVFRDVSAILYVWQGGMQGGNGVSRILTGKASPSGHLPDTIAKSIKDYPSDKNFYFEEELEYAEDIFVGYRYFETFARDKVLYPFGYGLSYTKFDLSLNNIDENQGNFEISICVKNVGGYEGKAAPQIYMRLPAGRISKPERVLVAFFKTPVLAPGEECIKRISIDRYSYASFDDTDGRETSSSYVLEKGRYVLFVGENVRDERESFSFDIDTDIVLEKLESHLGPVKEFKRMERDEEGNCTTKDVPLSKTKESKLIEERKPADIPFDTKNKYKLKDVYDKKINMDEFVATLTKEELVAMIHGEGMGSPKVTPGTAAAYGGVTDSLQEKGIPAVCCSDGPSGMRIDSGERAFSLPNGTMIASTFDTELIEKLYTYMGTEMRSKNIDNILGPGINIHRHPLNGRNFEYFSEDPLLTGLMASATIKGLKKGGSTGTLKHFATNNREHNRTKTNGIISEKALREIYLKGFEIAVKQAKADSIMTSYGLINGGYTSGRYELNTSILRDEWGFEGIVMTDWWAITGPHMGEGSKTDFSSMVKAGNDIYMVCSSAQNHDDNLMEELENGSLSIGQLQVAARHILGQVMSSYAFLRLNDMAESVEIVGRETHDQTVDFSKIKNISYTGDELIINLSEYKLGNEDYAFVFVQEHKALYEMSITFSSDLTEVAQIPVSFFSQNYVTAVVTFNGTKGRDETVKKMVLALSKYSTVRMHMVKGGVDIKEIRLREVKNLKDAPDEVVYGEKKDIVFC